MTTHEKLTLEEMATKIVEYSLEADKKFDEADWHLLEAARLIVMAREKFKNAGMHNWLEWSKQHIKLKESRIQELYRIGKADDPNYELNLIRAETRERVAKHRAKKKAQSCEAVDPRYVTVAEQEAGNPDQGSDPKLEQELVSGEATTLVSESHLDQDHDQEQPTKQPKRTAAQDRTRLVEFGNSVIGKKTKISSFQKMAETPSEAGLVVLVAYVGLNGSTDVKGFVTDKTVVDLALYVVGKLTEAEASDADASSVSARRNEPINMAIEDARSKANLPNLETA